MLNNKHYIIVPSVYFMTVLDITDPKNIRLHNNLPLQNYVYDIYGYKFKGQYYFAAIGYDCLLNIGINENAELSITNNKTIEKGALT